MFIILTATLDAVASELWMSANNYIYYIIAPSVVDDDSC